MKSKINFYLKSTSKNDGRSLINLFVSNKQFPQRFKFSTGYSIEPEIWDNEKQRAVIQKRTPRQYQNLNDTLDSLTTAVSDFERKCELESMPLSKEGLKAFLEKKIGKESNNVERPKLFDFIAKTIEEKQQKVGVSDETIRQHRIAVLKLKEFSTVKKRNKLDWEGIENPLFVGEFHDFLKEKKLSLNTIAKTTKQLNVLFQSAKELNYLSENAVKKLRVAGDTADAIALEDSEIEQVWNFDLSEKPRLERARDLFVFGCMTGLRFEDWTKIERRHIKKITDSTGNVIEIIEFLSSKTKTVVTIPVFSITRAILEKYNYNLPKNYLGQKVVSNQKTNNYLKEIFELMGWIEEIVITKSIAAKRQEVIKRKCDLVSTHTARRSFITNMIARGLNYEIISKATGHKDIDSFKKYNKLSGERAAITMYNLFNKE